MKATLKKILICLDLKNKLTMENDLDKSKCSNFSQPSISLNTEGGYDVYVKCEKTNKILHTIKVKQLDFECVESSFDNKIIRLKQILV